MEQHSSPNVQAILATVVVLLLVPLLLLLQSLRRFLPAIIALPKEATDKKTRAPEPSGAWPLIGHLLLLGRSKDPSCKLLGAISDKYGAVYSLKFGIHDLLVVSGSEIVKDCLTTNDRALATRASIAVGKHMGYNHAVFAVAPYGPYWRHVRKMATLQLLSNHRIDSLTGVRLSELHEFIKELYRRGRDGLDSVNKSGRDIVNMSEMLERLKFNMSLRMLVGKRFGYTAENGEARRYKEAVEEAVRLSGVFVASDAVPWMEWFDFGGHVAAMKRSAKVIDEVVGKWLEEHAQNINGDVDGDRDFMQVMMSSLGCDGDAASSLGHTGDTIIKATTLTLTLTGSGSTSLSVTWALSLLLNHPNTLKSAQEELDIEVGRARWVQESDIPNLKYLHAIVKETLRLYPPGPLTAIREAMEDCCIGGYHVSKGTRVVINIWKLHRDPKVWDNPTAFRPERFLTSHADVDVIRGLNFEYIPFSYGRRSCPAVNLGMRVVHLVLARVLQGFDLATSNGLPVDMAEGQGIALVKVKPLEVVVVPRMGSELYSFD